MCVCVCVCSRTHTYVSLSPHPGHPLSFSQLYIPTHILVSHIHPTRHSKNVELLLADPRVDPNQADEEGVTPLFAAANYGRHKCVALLLADPQVDPNLARADGQTPLFAAAMESRARCLELLLADKRVDVTLGPERGNTPLAAACAPLAASAGRVLMTEIEDPARCLVLMLRSRRISDQHLEENIAYLSLLRVSKREEAAAEPVMRSNFEMARIVVPVLEAQLKGERRWCAHCLKLTPDKDIDLCSACHQVGYCRPLSKMQLRRMPHEEQERRRKVHCQTLHWKAGHKQDCKRWVAEAAERAAADGAAGGSGGGNGSGNGGEDGDGGNAGTGKQKGTSKGKKKGKKGRGR